MDYLTSAPREIARRLNRSVLRREIAAIRVKLAKAETALGLLGWQQADFESETHKQVQAIQDVEREQSRLTNEAATISRKIASLQSEYQSAQRDLEEQQRRLETERKRLSEPYEALERQLQEKRKIEPNFVARIPELDRELRDVQRVYSELLVTTPQTPQIRAELIRLRERVVAIPNEKSDLRTQHLRTVSEIHSLEEEKLRYEAPLKDLTVRIETLQKEWSERSSRIEAEIAAQQAEKRSVESQIDSLEGAKENPYQRIGRVLANSDIAPLNQPEALQTVKSLEAELENKEGAVQRSRDDSNQEDPVVLRGSFGIWLFVCVLVLLFLAHLAFGK